MSGGVLEKCCCPRGQRDRKYKNTNTLAIVIGYVYGLDAPLRSKFRFILFHSGCFVRLHLRPPADSVSAQTLSAHHPRHRSQNPIAHIAENPRISIGNRDVWSDHHVSIRPITQQTKYGASVISSNLIEECGRALAATLTIAVIEVAKFRTERLLIPTQMRQVP